MITAGATLNSDIITDNLTFLFDFADKSSFRGGGTVVNNLADTGSFDGVLINGPTWGEDTDTSGSYSGALDFDSTDDIVKISNPPNSYTKLTACLWAMTDSYGQYQGIFTQQLSGSPTAAGWSFPTNFNGSYYYFLRTGSADNFINSGVTVVTGIPKFYCLTWSTASGNIKFYIDGVLKHTTSSVTTAMGTDMPAAIGLGGLQWTDTDYDGYDSSAQAHDGKVYMAYMYEKELTAEQILHNYNATRGRFRR